MRRIGIPGYATVAAALAIAGTVGAGEPEALLPNRPSLDSGVSLDEAGGATQVHLNLIDQKLALSLAVDTEWQITMSRFALDGVTSDALRQFVARRLEGQQDFCRQLNRLTKGRTRKALARARREIEADRDPTQVPEKKFRLLSVRNATAMLARVRLEILQDYAAMQQQALAAASADEFDRRYLRYDLLNQMQALATLGVFEAQASEDFAQVIHAVRVRTRQQFAAAQRLLRQMETAPLADVATSQEELADKGIER